jgi:hypothetical protein
MLVNKQLCTKPTKIVNKVIPSCAKLTLLQTFRNPSYDHESIMAILHTYSASIPPKKPKKDPQQSLTFFIHSKQPAYNLNNNTNDHFLHLQIITTRANNPQLLYKPNHHPCRRHHHHQYNHQITQQTSKYVNSHSPPPNISLKNKPTHKFLDIIPMDSSKNKIKIQTNLI